MNTPQWTPIETRPAKFTTIKLAVGAAVLATIAAVAAKCNSCVEHLHDDAGTVSDVLNGDDETGLGGETEEKIDANAIQEPKPDMVTPATDGGKDTGEKTVDKHRLLNERMDALTSALARKYPFMPEPTGQDGSYNCDDQRKIQSPMNLLREAVWVGSRENPIYIGDQVLHIMDGVQGCSAAGQLFSLVYRESSGKLALSISGLENLRDGGLMVSSSENDIEIAIGYVNIVDEYLRKRAYLKTIHREYWDNENRQPHHSSEQDYFRSRIGYNTMEEAECRLKETYRANLIVYAHRWMPPPPDGWDIESRKRDETDNGDIFCGEKKKDQDE